MNQILLIEDDPNLALNIKNFLSKEGFSITNVMKIADIPKSLEMFNIIILDWMLPDGQGLDYIKKFRMLNQKTPVLFLTAKVELIDKVLGLESGANDYLTKPFEPRELLARIRAQLRIQEFNNSEESEIGFDDIRINLKSRIVLKSGMPVELTRKEFDLLSLFVSSPHQVFTREELLNKIWGFEHFPTTRTVDTHILQLRQKLDEHLFETVRGIGYRLCLKK